MKLWLSGVDEREKVAGVKAIREAASMGGMESVAFAHLSGALDVWHRVAKGRHVLIVQTDSPDVMRRVTKVLDGGHLRYQLTQDDEMPKDVEPEAPQEPEPEPDPFIPTVEATQCAAVLLTQTDSPGDALSTARAISRITQDDFWEDVAEYIIRTFPAPPQIMEALLAARQS